MGFTRNASTFAFLAVAMVAVSAHADDRLSTYGYFRISTGAQLSPTKGKLSEYSLAGVPRARLGNEGDWSEIGWTLKIYNNDDGVEGSTHFMIGAGPLGGSFGFQELYVDIKNLVAGSKIWAGKYYSKREFTNLTDFQYLTHEGLGAGIEDIKLGEKTTLSYGLYAADTSVDTPDPTDPTATVSNDIMGFRHQVSVRGIPLGEIGAAHVDVALAHPVAEDIDGVETTSGYSGTAMVDLNLDAIKGSDRIVIQAGGGALGDANGFAAGANLLASEDATKFRVANFLNMSPTDQLSVAIELMYQGDAYNSSGGRHFIEGGARLSYYFNQYVGALLEVQHQQNNAIGEEDEVPMLTKVTPAIEITTDKGNVPHIRIFGTYATWNDAAAVIADETSAFKVGIQGEAWF